MHYVYTETGKDVEPGVKVYTIPPGLAESMPNGGPVTGDGKMLTAVKDEADFGNSPFGTLATGTEYTKVDLIAEIREQLNRIESKVTGG